MEQIGKSENYMIVFNDGSKKEIESILAEQILKASTTAQKTFIIGLQFYSFSNISKLIPLSEYYNQYPGERPQHYNYKKIDYKSGSFKREKALEQIIKGFKKHFEGREMTGVSKTVFDKMECRFAGNKFEEKNPVKDFYSVY